MMRSVFWRIFASFLLAIILVACCSLLAGRAFNQDAWILRQHPGLKDFAQTWTTCYETQGIDQAYTLLKRQRMAYKIDTQVLTETGRTLATNRSTHHRLPNSLTPPPKPPLRWRQITQEYTSPQTNNSYLFIYRISYMELDRWHRHNFWLPISALVITLTILTLFSLLLTLYITRPLNRLRLAVNALGKTAYQKNSLAYLANRKDEFGVLAKEFSLMGEQLQTLIANQRQLLRDVSHELRSPLTRLKITLALLEKSNGPEKEKLISRLSLECDRLENLIGEVLNLARLESLTHPKTTISLTALLNKLTEDAKINAPQQQIILNIEKEFTIKEDGTYFERALDNIIRNALRFNPESKPIEINAWLKDQQLHISIRDHGVGVPLSDLPKLGTPFFRLTGQTHAGYGLGLTLCKRTIEYFNGQLSFKNHPRGGFLVEIIIPCNV